MGTRRTIKPRLKTQHFVKEWRKHLGMTQEDLAEKVGTVVSSISQLENGRQGYSQAMLESLAEAFGCTPADILRIDPSRAPEAADIATMLKEAQSEVKREAVGYIRGLTRAQNH